LFPGEGTTGEGEGGVILVKNNRKYMTKNIGCNILVVR
jgi:hypothetical protein